MGDWYATAAVRRWSWADALAAEQTGSNYFAPGLVTATKHPRARDAGPATVHGLQRRHLFRYLAATETIEVQLVNPALCYVMKQPALREFVPEAYRIYTDEGFHAAMGIELRQHLLGVADVPHATRYHSAGLAQVFSICDALPVRERELALFVAASLNETLITPSLRQSTDPTVITLVRRLIEAHAADEAVHHVFFAKLFNVVWAGLTYREQLLLAELIPRLSQALLLTDWDAVGQDLLAEGFAPAEVSVMTQELISAAQPLGADSVAGMARMLQRSGAAQFGCVQRHLASLLDPTQEFVA